MGPSNYEEATSGSLLHEVPNEERDSGSYADNHEERKTGHTRNMWRLRDKVVQNREELSPNPPKDTDGRREDSGRGWVRELQGRRPGVGVDGRPAAGLQSPHRAPKALCGSCDARDGERIRSRGLSRPGWREIAGTLGQLQAGRQAGNGMACSRAKARLNWVSQGQRRGRCKVRRRAERVIRPTRAKTRRLRVLVIAVRSPRPIRAVQRARLCAITRTASQAPLAAKRADGMWFARRRT